MSARWLLDWVKSQFQQHGTLKQAVYCHYSRKTRPGPHWKAFILYPSLVMTKYFKSWFQIWFEWKADGRKLTYPGRNKKTEHFQTSRITDFTIHAHSPNLDCFGLISFFLSKPDNSDLYSARSYNSPRKQSQHPWVFAVYNNFCTSKEFFSAIETKPVTDVIC